MRVYITGSAMIQRVRDVGQKRDHRRGHGIGTGGRMKIQIYAKGGFKLITKDLNRRKAMRERCMNCSAWVTKDVAECFADDCPLYPYRSGKGKQNAKARSKAIREYCL